MEPVQTVSMGRNEERELKMEQPEVPTKILRQFGLLVGGILLALALYPFVWKGQEVRTWLAIPGGLLAAAGLVVPNALSQVYRGWMAVGHALGWVNTRIILGIVFYGIVTPMGLVMKMMGMDPMRRGFDPTAKSYRVARQARAATHMRHMF